MANILWLHPPNLSGKMKRVLVKYIEKEKIRESDIFFVPLIEKLPHAKTKRGQKTIIYNKDQMENFNKLLQTYILKVQPSIIVVNDPFILSFLLDQSINALMLYRGSVYHKFNLPCLVIDDPYKITSVKEFPWIIKQDIKKLKRWLDGNQRVQPKFVYKICETKNDLDDLRDYMADCFLIADDIETAGGVITLISLCGLSSSGQLLSYCVPFVNPLKPGGCHWDTEEDEVYAWETIRRIHSNSAFKVFQNGSYDSAYYMSYRTAPKRYIFDTLHMFNSVWTEADKKLWFISSILLDYCRYWKDESKGESKSKDKSQRVPATQKGYAMYLRYGAQDVYNTLLDCLMLTLVMTKPATAWTLDNYNKEIRQQLGPALDMTMTGMVHDKERQSKKVAAWTKEYEESLKDLRIMADDETYNPFSSFETASLIYDVLGAEPVKLRGRSAKKLPERTTDEKIFRIIASRHPLYSVVINKIWDTKKPSNNISKYGKSLGVHGRFYYSLSCTLETFRYRSGNHPFWIGTNVQNIPKDIRDMFVADKDYIFWEVDYSQSDLYFVAYQCEDPKLLEVVNDDRDTHCVHCAYFFKKPYETILEAHKAEKDWTDHPVEGIRQITKKITHGASYQMAAYTLFIQMGREMAVATCLALGYKDARTWKDSQIVNVLGNLLEGYFKLYPGLTEWQSNIPEECAKNGNRADNGFGRTRLFFGDVRNDNAVQRELSSYYGQGGTAGNVNRVLDKIYWKTDLLKEGLRLYMQGHDSILFGTPVEKMYLGNEFLTIMQEPVTIKGRTFSVPVDAKVGLSWGKAMIPYREGITYAEIKEADKRWERKKYGNGLELVA